MSGTGQIDYNALAAQSGAIASASRGGSVDYNALAKESGAISSVSPSSATQSSAISRFVQGVASNSPLALVKPPEDVTEEGVNSIGGATGLAAYRTARALVDSVNNLVNSKRQDYQGAIAAFHQALADAKAGKYGAAIVHGGEAAGNAVDLMQPPGVSLKQPFEEGAQVREQAKSGDVAGAAGSVAGKAVTAAGAVLLPEAGEEGEAASEEPGLIKQISGGKGIEQAPAKAAIRQAASAPEEQPIIEGNKTVLDQKLSDLNTQRQAAYKQMDDAAGFDLKAEKDTLSNDQYKLKQLGNTEADQSMREKLQASISDSQQRIADAEKTLKDRGIDPKGADKLNQQLMAGKQVKKALVASTKADGSVDVSGFLNRLKNLRFDKFGDRPAQFFGKDATDRLMEDLQTAHDQGVRAMTRQRTFQTIKKAAIGTVAGAAGGAVAYDLLKK